MAYNLNTFVIDRVLRGVMLNKDGSIAWTINQIEDPSLNCTSEEREAVDALGTPIATFQNGKEAEFSAQNSLFDLGLLAAQMGTEKESATEESMIVVPVFHTADVKSGVFKLDKAPKGEIAEIYTLRGDGTTGEKYAVVASEPTAKEFAYNAETMEITVGGDVADGTQFFVVYETETAKAVQVSNSAVEFPKAGKFVMEILGCDVCDPETLIYAYLIFPNAKLDSNVDITLTTDGKHPFSMKAQQAYCDKKKLLFNIVVPETEE